MTDHSSPPPNWLFRRVPALDALRTYTAATFGRDLMAGLTVATVAVPQAMAYALLAGLPPEYGLYTAIVMTAVGALLDSSRLLINGPTNAISIALLSAMVAVPEADRVSTAIIMASLVGSIQLGIALLRFGDLTRYVSHSVIIGFTVGASTLLVLNQAQHFLGLPSRGEPTEHFLIRFWATVSGGSVHWPTAGVGCGTVAIVLLVRQWNRLLKRRGYRFPVPQHLVAVSVAAAVVWASGLDQNGVRVVGHVPAALPSFRLPELNWEQVRVLAGSAFAIALLGLLEAVAMAKALAAPTGQRLDVNQQCLSEGAANLVGSFFQCFPGSGSLTRSAVNQQSGAVTQWAGVFSALGVAATVAVLAPLAGHIPHASLAGLLILAAYRMVDGRQLLFHCKATRFDAGVIAATAFAAVFISIEFCILIGVFLSFALYVPKVAQVRLVAKPADPGGREYELEGELFFGAEGELHEHFTRMVQETGTETRVGLTLRNGRNHDATFLALLDRFRATLAAKGVRVVLRDPSEGLIESLRTTGSLSAFEIDQRPPAGVG